MTQAQRQTVNGWLSQTKEIVLIIGALMATAVGVWGAVQWVTGGLKPQTQIVTEDLTKSVGAIQTDVTDIKKAIGALPHPYEFDEQRAHFSRLDRDVADSKSITSGIEGRVSALERQQQYRNPK